MTAEQIIETMEQRVLANEPITPATWVESSIRVVLLSGELDNELANFEAMLNSIEAKYIETDMPASKAKVLARNQVDYGMYLRKKALKKRIESWVLLAKRRAVIMD